MNPKEIIVPLQRWLLTKGRCVCCGQSLRQREKQKRNGIVLVTCNCQRIFIYNPKVDSYRRALFQEI